MQIFDGQQTVARLEFLPADAALAAVQQAPVQIPEHVLFAGGGSSGQTPAAASEPRVLTEVGDPPPDHRPPGGAVLQPPAM